MKRISLLIISFVLFTSGIFARPFFADRYFEIRTGAEGSFSNNAYSFNDILVKELEIDFRKIAQKLPDEGFLIDYHLAPEYSINLNLDVLTFGINLGAEVSGKEIINKEFFDFLGYGYSVNDEMTMKLDTYFDAYICANMNFGMKIGKNRFQLAPSMFVPVASYSGRMMDLSYKNDEAGNIIVKLGSDMHIHTAFDYNNFSTNINEYINTAGFDLAAQFEFPVDYASSLLFKGRIPLLPGKLKYDLHETVSWEFDKNLGNLANGGLESLADISSPEISDLSVQAAEYLINRPLKAMLLYNYKPRASMFNAIAGFGLGMYHPFVDNSHFYIEYYVGAQMDLISVFKAGISTEYTEEVFKHNFDLSLNLRIIQLDVGVTLQSASFVKSLSGTGYGVHLYYSMGF